MEQKTDVITFRITPSLRRRFEAARRRQGHTQTDALIMLITRYCEEAERKMDNKGSVSSLQELTGRESGIVLYGRHGVMCNWSGMRGIPKEFATGLLDDFESIPVVEGVHVDDLTPYLDDADIDIMCNYDEETCPLDGGTVYKLGNGALVITPDGWI